MARRLIDVSRPITSIEPDRSAFPTATVALDRLVDEAVRAAGSRRRAPRSDGSSSSSRFPRCAVTPTTCTMLVRLIDNAREALPPRGERSG